MNVRAAVRGLAMCVLVALCIFWTMLLLRLCSEYAKAGTQGVDTYLIHVAVPHTFDDLEQSPASNIARAYRTVLTTVLLTWGLRELVAILRPKQQKIRR